MWYLLTLNLTHQSLYDNLSFDEYVDLIFKLFSIVNSLDYKVK